jgi:predicted transcriptional regulator
MQHAKDEIRHILDQLPDDASFDDIQYHIYVRQKIDRGLNDAAQGRLLTEEEFDRRMHRWLEP